MGKCKLFGALLPECRKPGSCKANRDKANNVCCKNPDLDKVENCVDLMSGRCPKAWQVPRDCCPTPNDKYAYMLTCDSKRSDLICCNAPCTAIEQAWRGSEGNLTAGIHPVPGRSQCTADGSQMPTAVKENCAPGKRSFLSGLMGGGAGGFGGGAGLDPSMLSQLMGMPVGESIDLGKVIPGMAGGTGLDGGATLAALQGLGFGASKKDHVDEITVDDFFDAIIEALDNDKDVFEYNKEINSDSWFGKQSFGGLVDGFKFIDPKKFINRIYGSPFGLSNAQAMFGMQYGIPMNKFQKHAGMHQTMTGFQNPYGPPPPSYKPAPPTPPPYVSPVYPGPIPEPEPRPEPVHEPIPEPVYQPYPASYPEPTYMPYPNLNPCITPSLSRQFITHLILSPLLFTIHPTLNLNPSIINHIPNQLQNLTILPSLNHIIPLSLSITLPSPSTTHPHPSRSHTTLRTNPMLTLSPHPTLNIIMATTHSPTLHLLRTEHHLHHLNLHQRSQQLQQPQILLLAILLLDNCMHN